MTRVVWPPRVSVGGGGGWYGAYGAGSRGRFGDEFASMLWQRPCLHPLLAAKKDRAGTTADRKGFASRIDHRAGGLVQNGGIHGEEAIARRDRMRRVSAMCGGELRDGDLEKSVAGNVERVAGTLKRYHAIVASFAAHQRAEVVRRPGRRRPRYRARRSVI